MRYSPKTKKQIKAINKSVKKFKKWAKVSIKGTIKREILRAKMANKEPFMKNWNEIDI